MANPFSFGTLDRVAGGSVAEKSGSFSGQAPGTSLLGFGVAGASTPAPSGGLFGAASTPAPLAPAAGALFGGAPAAAPGAPSTALFGAPASSSGGIFANLGGIGGIGAASTPAPSGGLFGAASTPAPLAPAAGALFGGPTLSSSGALFSTTSAFGLAATAVAVAPVAEDYLPRRSPRPYSQTNFLKEFLDPIDPNLKSQNGSNINMSDAVYLHQQHVNQCKAILKYCGAQEQRSKEEKSLKTVLDNDFEKYSRHHIFGAIFYDVFAGFNWIWRIAKTRFRTWVVNCTTC
jgi:hypothetical protein